MSPGPPQGPYPHQLTLPLAPLLHILSTGHGLSHPSWGATKTCRVKDFVPICQECGDKSQQLCPRSASAQVRGPTPQGHGELCARTAPAYLQAPGAGGATSALQALWSLQKQWGMTSCN